MLNAEAFSNPEEVTMFEKILSVVTTVSLVATFAPNTDAQSGMISLDHVSPLSAQGRVLTDAEITFYLRLTNDIGYNIAGVTNGFQVYSPDGAEWTTAVGDTLGTLAWGDVFDLIFSIGYFSANGQGADSVSFSGSRATSTGLPVGFDDTAYTITIGPIEGGGNSLATRL